MPCLLAARRAANFSGPQGRLFTCLPAPPSPIKLAPHAQPPPPPPAARAVQSPRKLLCRRPLAQAETLAKTVC